MIIDSHCHLQMKDYSDDLQSVLSEAKKVGVCSFLVVGYDISSSIQAKELAEKYDSIHPVYGIHPYDTNRYSISVFSELENLINEYPPLAIGETGLDYYRDYSPKNKQTRFFNEHILLANKYNLPLVIHVRDAFDDTHTIMKDSNRKNDILHCFTGSEKDIKRFNMFNAFFGISGIITFKNNSLKSIVNLIPQNKILIETDAPYLSPVPKRGKRNEPANLIYTLGILSESIDMNIFELTNLLISNTEEAYRHKFNECQERT